MSITIMFAHLPIAVVVIALIALHIIVLGYWGTRRLGFRPTDVWTRIAVGGGVGFTLLGFEVFLLGHIGALTRAAFFASSAVMLLGFIRAYPRFASWRSTAFAEICDAFRENRLLTASVLTMLAIIILSGMRAPYMIDEIQYHWAAPLMWAQHHRWMVTPYHSTDGPVLTEMIYTLCALFVSTTAAHWTHTICLLILLAGSAALTRLIGMPPLAAIAACLACPIIVNESAISYNDVAAAGLMIAAYAALFSGKTASRGSILVAGLLFAGAFSVKPYTLTALPIAIVYAIWPLLLDARSNAAARKMLLIRAAALAVPAILMMGLWMERSKLMTGHTWQSEYKGLTAHSDSDKIWHSGEAVARVPSAMDIAELPIVPAVTTVMGNKEPYGGRTGLMLWLTPIGLLGLRALPDPQRRKAGWILAAGGAYFLLLGAIVLKTRFHIFTWVTLASIEAIAYHLFKNLPQPKARLGLTAFYVLMWAGMADSAHVLLGLAHQQS